MTDITTALERSAKRVGVKMYLNEKVNALNRNGDMFAVRTDHFSVSAKKLIIAVPSIPLGEITGDVATEIQTNYQFKAAAIYSYAWWENATLSHNITLKPFEIFTSVMTCLSWIMPYRHQTKAGSNASRYDLEKWAKRPFPGEEIYVVDEAYSVIDVWNEGYYALKEGWGIEQPEP
ncbi:hypothetical protein OS493_010142 [Desmophyllum pertusum]|uniref:Uncharacterized protein n=1 Tax=Desmophyllum pertusum TaxID=174260 RepID=A0A9W9YEZ9_9CNID|nr:hypothetical protein OS493_010142 [Desmophyllum pertusum]